MGRDDRPPPKTSTCCEGAAGGSAAKPLTLGSARERQAVQLRYGCDGVGRDRRGAGGNQLGAGAADFS